MEQQAIVERLRTALNTISPRLHELREMDEWKRFANAAVQEELIARAEALKAKFPFDKPDELKPEHLEEAAKELHEIQERWKTAADAPRAQAQQLWHRYRQAADPIQAQVREFFAHRAEERKGNLDRKMALIERAEALATVHRLGENRRGVQEAAGRMAGRRPCAAAGVAHDLEAVPRGVRHVLHAPQRRPRRAQGNMVRQPRGKEALCVRAEELASSTNWESAASEMRKLQAQWKTIGPVRRNKSEVIWQRFRTAADAFFDRYKRRDQIELEVEAGRSRSARGAARSDGDRCRVDG